MPARLPVLPRPARAPRLCPTPTTSTLHHRKAVPATSNCASSTRPSQITTTRTFASATTTTASPSSSSSSSSSSTSDAPSAKWLDDLKSRIGKCITFGCNAAQVDRTGRVLAAISTEWRDLLAGSNGFLTPGILSAADLAKAWGPAAAQVNHGRMGLHNHSVAWGDMDSFGHVNNTVYNKWAETARVNWLLHFATIDPENSRQWRQLMTMKHIGFIMQSITTKYKMPIIYPDHISVYFRTAQPMRQPTPYLRLQSLILSHKHKRIAATTEESIVVYNYQKASKADLPAFATPLFDKTWDLQQLAAEKAMGRIRELEAEVRKLEMETWDREDAVEDMGGGVGGGR